MKKNQLILKAFEDFFYQLSINEGCYPQVMSALEDLEREILNPTDKLLSKARVLINSLSAKERVENPKAIKYGNALIETIQRDYKKPLSINNKKLISKENV